MSECAHNKREEKGKIPPRKRERQVIKIDIRTAGELAGRGSLGTIGDFL